MPSHCDDRLRACTNNLLEIKITRHLHIGIIQHLYNYPVNSLLLYTRPPSPFTDRDKLTVFCSILIVGLCVYGVPPIHLLTSDKPLLL